ncbi:rho-related GTP-binding protein RhoU isoform X2 [Osmerus eperlanus]|uniref:rho-related GTP-binding protein RhoU isoform X2 n=1 Tax=Osmerus eperlanus TaxID=29151 RepID=UPI002E0DE29D
MGMQKARRVSDPVCCQFSPSCPKYRDCQLNSKRRRSGSVPERKVNCVLVGDGAVGKTSLIVSYTTNGYPTEYIPTAFDNFAAMVVVDGKPVRLQLCDMAGQEELDRLRPLCYRNADVFLLCYSVVCPSSLCNVTNRWVPEVRRICPRVPVVLVGTQLDLREDVQVLIHLAQNQETPLSAEEGQECAQEIGAITFIECSALTQKNLKDVFDSVILTGIQEVDSMQTLRKKTPHKIKSLSESWWKKLSCFVGDQEIK